MVRGDKITENKAITRMRYRIDTATEAIGKGSDGKAYEDMEIAIKALEEIQQYRAIGTINECMSANETKQKITEMINRQLIAGRNNYKEIYDCFYEIVKVIQDNY